MKIEEFNCIRWDGGMEAQYDGNIYPVAACDFVKQLIGLTGMEGNDPELVSWVPRKDVTIVKPAAYRMSDYEFLVLRSAFPYAIEQLRVGGAEPLYAIQSRIRLDLRRFDKFMLKRLRDLTPDNDWWTDVRSLLDKGLEQLASAGRHCKPIATT